jgi:hypothetical protein
VSSDDYDSKSHLFEMIYQSPDGNAPDVKIGSSMNLEVLEPENISETRLWIVKVRWKAEDTLANGTDVWVESARLKGGQTIHQKVKVGPPIYVPVSSSNQLSLRQSSQANKPGRMNVEAATTNDWLKPKIEDELPVFMGMGRKSRDMTWQCVSPLPLPEHWTYAQTERLDQGKLSFDLLTKTKDAFPISIRLSKPGDPLNDLKDLMMNFYHAGAHDNIMYLERQWLLALVWAEVGGQYDSSQREDYQQMLLLGAFMPCTLLAFEYFPPLSYGDYFLRYGGGLLKYGKNELKMRQPGYS